MRSALAAALLCAGCASIPITPDPSVDLVGDWRVTAVNGRSTPALASSFRLRYAPPSGSAQFGCNEGNGAASTGNGWFVTGNWIITAASCPGERGQFERTGFAVLGRPLAIERIGPSRVRLRNERGSLTLEREPVPQLAGTRWRVLSINGRAAGATATIHFSPSSYEADFGCNRVLGSFSQLANRLQMGMSKSEIGCLDTVPAGVSTNVFENWGANVLASDPTVTAAGKSRVLLENRRGTILLERLP